MSPRRFALLIGACVLAWLTSGLLVSVTFHHEALLADALFAAPRWWDDTVAWIRSIGWDRSRLVQLWLLFMLVGLYIMLRIKPRG
ncbi:MAG TPA: hypothetical protein PKA06_02015 [Gemmatales bacterium]|nr:hypothetical protein [Gemmatales bacterium]HMP15900.1 hypothetical protein [Gemmatales bacterium]